MTKKNDEWTLYGYMTDAQWRKLVAEAEKLEKKSPALSRMVGEIEKRGGERYRGIRYFRGMAWIMPRGTVIVCYYGEVPVMEKVKRNRATNQWEPCGGEFANVAEMKKKLGWK